MEERAALFVVDGEGEAEEVEDVDVKAVAPWRASRLAASAVGSRRRVTARVVMAWSENCMVDFWNTRYRWAIRWRDNAQIL